jgi:hypothetical protein
MCSAAMTRPTSRSSLFSRYPVEDCLRCRLSSDTVFFAVMSTVPDVVFADCLGWLGQQSAKQPVFLSVI